MPHPVHVLEDLEPGSVLVDAADVVQIETQEHAGQDLVNNLMTDQGDRLAGMMGGQFVQQSVKTCLDGRQTFSTWEAHLARPGAPLGIGLGMSGLGFRVGQALQLAVVDVQQSAMGLHGQGPLQRPLAGLDLPRRPR